MIVSFLALCSPGPTLHFFVTSPGYNCTVFIPASIFLPVTIHLLLTQSVGATLTQQPGPGESPQMSGSVMIKKAESEEEVREWLRSDIYAKSGVWNVDGAKIMPVSCCFPFLISPSCNSAYFANARFQHSMLAKNLGERQRICYLAMDSRICRRLGTEIAVKELLDAVPWPPLTFYSSRRLSERL